MSTSEQSLRIDVRDGASCRDVEVATHQNCANRRAWLDGLRLMLIGCGPYSHYGSEACLGELRSKLANRVFRKPAEHEGSFDGLHQRCEAAKIITRRKITPNRGFRHHLWSCSAARVHRFWLTAVERVDLKHFFNGSNAANRFLREHADSIRDGPHELAIYVHGAAAHARHDTRVLHLFAMQPTEYQVALRPIQVGQHAQNFDIHGLRLHAFKHGVCNAAHSPMNVADLHHLWGHTSRGSPRRDCGLR